MAESNWKTKFTQKQLEKKRLADRLSQRRSRQQTRQTVAELEDRIQLLVRGDHAALVQQLSEENVELRNKISMCDSRLRIFLSLTNFSADDDDSDMRQSSVTLAEGDVLDKRAKIVPASPLQAQSSEQSHEIFPHPTAVPSSTSNGQSGSENDASKGPPISIVFEAASLLKRMPREASAEEFAAIDFIEAIMIWRLNNNHGFGFDLISRQLDLNNITPPLTTARIKSQTASADFFNILVQNLISDQNAPPEAATHDSPETVPSTRIDVARQRRCVAFCVWKLIASIQPPLKSKLVEIAIFWALYRYALFLTIPTDQNLHKTPTWLWPIRSQFTYEHPASIDFLMWPAFRGILAKTWRSYDLQALYLTLFRSLELSEPEKWPDVSTVIKPTQDLADIDIDPVFESMIGDMNNFYVNDEFGQEYPEFAHCVGSTIGRLRNPPPQDMQLGINTPSSINSRHGRDSSNIGTVMGPSAQTFSTDPFQFQGDLEARNLISTQVPMFAVPQLHQNSANFAPTRTG